jgi:hypothetical protein
MDLLSEFIGSASVNTEINATIEESGVFHAVSHAATIAV